MSSLQRIKDSFVALAPVSEAGIAKMAADFDLEPEGAALLAIYDRVLRTLSAEVEEGLDVSILETTGYALSGSTALFGVYLPANKPIRVPEALWFAPTASAPLVAPESLARLVAAAVPGSTLADDGSVGQAHRFTLVVDGINGRRLVSLAIEEKRLVRPSPIRRLEGGARAGRRFTERPGERLLNGYMVIGRMPYHSYASARTDFVHVPTAYPDEILTRELIALSTPGMTVDARFLTPRADSLRAALAADQAGTTRILSEDVRDFLAFGLLRRAEGAQMTELGAVVGQVNTAIADLVTRVTSRVDNLRLDTLPPHLRRVSQPYTLDMRREFHEALGAALEEVRRPFDAVELSQLKSRFTA